MPVQAVIVMAYLWPVVALAEGLMKVIIYGVADNPKLQNRGFAFLEYDSHKSASTAKRKLGSSRTRVWNCDIIVDWADPQSEPEDEIMEKVSVQSTSLA